MATLLHGDCLTKMKALPDKSVDCFICDLPYGQLNKKSKGCPWDVKIDLKEFWVQVKRLCKDDHTPVIMFCNTKFGFELYNSNPTWFKYDLIWNKGRGVSFLDVSRMPMKSHEMIYVFSKKGAFYKRKDIVGTFASWKSKESTNTTRIYSDTKDNKLICKANDGTTRCALSIIDVTRPRSIADKHHPTEKPLELYKWLLERYCPEGGTVLDPTAGSFNSIVAARQLGFKGIGIEMDNTFFYRGIQKLYSVLPTVSS